MVSIVYQIRTQTQSFGNHQSKTFHDPKLLAHVTGFTIFLIQVIRTMIYFFLFFQFSAIITR